MADRAADWEELKSLLEDLQANMKRIRKSLPRTLLIDWEAPSDDVTIREVGDGKV